VLPISQQITERYLRDRQYCAPEQIAFIYGGVFPADRLAPTPPRRYYGEGKDTFDLCFVAHKYMPRGVDKGYDVFIAVAQRLSPAHRDIHFHVVGPFDETDLDVSAIRERITFYGTRATGFFRDFYARMDLILSPNVPFVLFPGS